MADQYYTRPDLLAEPDWLWDHRHDPGPQSSRMNRSTSRAGGGIYT